MSLESFSMGSPGGEGGERGGGLYPASSWLSQTGLFTGSGRSLIQRKGPLD